MPESILLIPLLGGYFLLSQCNFTKFKLVRDDSQRLIFKSATLGLLSFCLSFFLIEVIYTKWLGCEQFWDNYLPEIVFLDVALFSFLLCVIIAYTYNFLSNKGWKISTPDVIKASLIVKDDDPIELLLLDALIREYLVQVTLQNGKVYVGYITNNPFSIKDELNSILMIPYISGYRDNSNHRIEFTTDYTAAYEEITQNKGKFSSQIQDFQLAIAYSQIISLNQFDMEIYQECFDASKPS